MSDAEHGQPLQAAASSMSNAQWIKLRFFYRLSPARYLRMMCCSK